MHAYRLARRSHQRGLSFFGVIFIGLFAVVAFAIGANVLINTKFNAVVTRGWYREATLRSGYIYQIYAYLRSQENEKDPLAANALGLLLHPSVGDMVDERVVIQGHEIRFATVDLAASARDIRAQLLRVLDIPVAA